MQFHIEELILWPVNRGNGIHTLPFEPGKVNIIFGRSRTGKSSIISIIDYCLGASRCAIPVGKIRDSVSWFGLRVNISGKSFVIARRTPGSRQTSNEFYLAPFEEGLPEVPEYSHNDTRFKERFNNLVRLTNLSVEEGDKVKQHDGRPSYRDLAAFNFLPQHIVANPNTLFFKADTYDHKERLKKVMPFAFGIIDGTYLMRERERAQLLRELDQLLKQQESRKSVMSSWEGQVERLWSLAVELGMVDAAGVDGTDDRVAALKSLAERYAKGELESTLKTPDYGFTNERYKQLQDDEEAAQTDVDDLRRQIRGFERLSERAQKFSNAVGIERSRVVNLNWLKSSLSEQGACVVCGNATDSHHTVISHLATEMERISELSDALFENPIVDKEIEAAKTALMHAQRKLHSARSARVGLQRTDGATRDSLSKVYVLLGRIQALLMGIDAVRGKDEFTKEIERVSSLLDEVAKYLNGVNKDAREEAVDNKLAALIGKYADELKLEKRGSVRLDKQELTLSFSGGEGSKKEYLWEVGSGENWMGYHIATFLAIHEFLSDRDRSSSPVFSFLVIDQPSQVYFPSAATGANQLDTDAEQLGELRRTRDQDFVATRRIFEVLEMGLRATDYKCQIIVLDHADDTIWGELPDTVNAANWKAPDAGLIPHWWR
ncbi:DUF3732 domain-containing protein [Paraburkholderia domus]|uniref:DUF3732 domain-containing protein n=1 Tax=Paraburkholderia domus TaxID=2793075 RepID=A0A9N8MMH5_9BURK|nr:DUF3732 domain-containing protein [Paraburkholderia domus]MBK5164831.1 DUF3732 domain-containing protein [Burkholderia sp. R-70211]CAE6872248.1 hypothetical protein R70211_01342 [Paraburkholderia domus]